MSPMQTTLRLALAAMMIGSALDIGVRPAAAQSAVSTQPARKSMSSEELYEHVLKSTCWVVLPNGSGTGWVLDKEKRLLVTNHHVVDGFDDVKAYFPQKRGDAVNTDPNWYRLNAKSIAGKVIDRSKHRDLALIQLEALPANAAALPLAPQPAKQGQEIMTIGASTRGSDGLWGWVDGKVRNIVDGMTPTGKLRQIESNVSTNSGNSGGPVVNNRGEIVAVHFAASLDARNVSYHVDQSELKTFLAVALSVVEPKGAAGFIARGDRRLLEKRDAAAREDFAAAIKIDVKSARAHLGRGMASYNLNDAATAIPDFDEALRLQADYQLAFYYRGMARFKNNQFETAADDFTQSIRLNPKSAVSYNERGRAYYEMKKHSEAESDFSRAIEWAPTALIYWQNRGLAREKQGNLDEALADMEKAIDCAPKNARAYSMLAYMLFRADRYEAAMKIHFKADELDIKNPIHAENVGHCLKQMEKFEAAIRLFNLALERAEKYDGQYRIDTALCSRGYCQRRLQNYNASLADHNRSLKINPNRAETYYQRAWTYRWLGQYNLAKDDYDKAVSLDAEYASKEAPVVVRTNSYYGGFRR